VLVLDTRTRRLTGTLTRGRTYYAVGVDSVSGDVYLADARNYVQPGAVEIFSRAGAVVRSFDVGVNPGSFAFRQ
jgi:DNA-binding beta-propeller fold protein YncE